MNTTATDAAAETVSLFPGGMALIYTVIGILVIVFIWLLLENPRVALSIAEGVAKALFAVLRVLIIVLWSVLRWSGKMLMKLFGR